MSLVQTLSLTQQRHIFPTINSPTNEASILFCN